jgi:hypothetical protein
MNFFSFLIAIFYCVVGFSALAPASKAVNRRSWLATIAKASSVTLLMPEIAVANGDASVFCGTYSDPINHPGGKRTIRLLDGKQVGQYQLAEVQGGGGVGEPDNYVLPAVIIGDRSIIIDFSPKGNYPRIFLIVAAHSHS